MSFLQPLLLLGLPLALTPIIIHLLNRLRYRSVKWGAMMFVLKANRSSTNMARIRQWLILAARVLAILALIVAISRPLLGGWLGWKFSGEPDTVIILLDRSATMGSAFNPKQSRLEKALDLIIESGKQSASTSRIVLIDSALLGVNEIPSWDVLSQIEKTKITQTEADIPAMYRIALDYMTNNVTGVTEVWALSDMQQSNWDSENSEWSELDSSFASLAHPVTFRTLAIESETKDNRSISFIKLSEYPGKEENTIREIFFEINSPAGLNSGEIPLQIIENGSKRQLTVKISGQSTRIRHTLSDSDETKTVYGSISLPPDSNLSDNSFYFGFAPKAPEKAIVIFDNPNAAMLLSAAAAPQGESMGQSAMMISASKFAETNLESASIIICQVEPGKEMLKNLRTFALTGGNVIFFPPSATNSNNSMWYELQKFEKDKELIVTEWDTNDGPLANTVEDQQLMVDSLKLKKRILLKNTKSIPISSCSDGKPFMYGEKVGKGMIYYCTTLPVPEWSNLGDGLVIVPMLRRLMLSGSQRLSNVVFNECGKWKPDPGSEKYDILASDKMEGDESNPLCDTGVYSEEDKIVILNRSKTENVYNKIDENIVKTLFENNPITMFTERGSSMSKMQAGVWRLFLFAVLCAMMVEAFLCLPAKVKSKSK